MSALQPFNSTNPQICMWSSLHKGNLLEHYVKSRDPLNELSQESSKITSTDLSSEQACNRSIENLTDLFEKLSFGTTEAQKVERVKKLIFDKVIASKVSTLSLYDLIERIDAQKSKIPSSFAKHCIYKKMGDIESCSNAKGIIYKITNELGVTSVMIGTIHKVPPKTVHLNGRVQKILSQVKRVVFEGVFSTSKTDIDAYKRQLEAEEQVFNSSCDFFFLEEALRQELPISFLESRQYCMENLFRIGLLLSTSRKPPTNRFVELHQDSHDYELLEHFQNGNFEGVDFQMKSNMTEKPFTDLLIERNKAWVYGDARLCPDNRDGLLKQLKETEVPLAIVVGVGHMVFEEGLPKLLEKGGLRVERDS